MCKQTKLFKWKHYDARVAVGKISFIISVDTQTPAPTATVVHTKKKLFYNHHKCQFTG